ncbi:cation transporter [Gluconacetobacter liquefaciens]|uniref:Cobalt-zinc-cadmium resistance protein CzcA n=1 Tax=Gluconacetobacter liquefaciens TaxID=89584 RepID=A0A370G423_GLULI|nr:CusA/CzcA family heavy metal efflux RND transporter [Gluconacetobacter liquefaciens]MBB2187744.1 efflux RND transporter permease subunit [Gluconacetobacter liquefaciens]RDI37354.1 cobalt-zinc-cadmium resistance protein CzcA [Gluconacetobacter liquefaciens]GBR07114.1 cobalt/zinc/cadmium resistance heavy metal efflux pump protein CzcA [Gluconacetobacter liquefaciens NRIC 0522]GEB39293.1 cation transporter [Gluconacetobacter liquefaciens]
MKAIYALLRGRGIVLGLVALFMLACVADLRTLPVEPVPDISPTQVMLSVLAPGLPSEEVERLVTFPVETAMAGVPGMTGMRSVSRTGVAVIYLQFADGSDIYLDRTLVSQRMSEARSHISVRDLSFTMGPLATGMGEILQFQLRGPGMGLPELNRIMTWQVVPRLKLVQGVIDVNINGGAEETFKVALDPERMQAYGVSVTDVFHAVDQGNAVAGGAWIEHNDQQQVIVGRTLIDNLAELAEIQVRSGPNGQVIHIGDVGTVSHGARPRLGAVTRDGTGEIVNGVVLLQQGASAKATLAHIHDALPAIQRSLPPGMTLDVYYSRSALTGATIDTVKENLALGAILVLVALLVVIGDWRASLVIISVIPFALLAAMTGMHHLGISANLLSLGAIDFGMVVDSSLVIVESVISMPTHRGVTMEQLIATSLAQVVRPVSFAILVIIMVYLPVLTLQGVEGRMFSPMAQTVILALLASLAFSLFCVPVLTRLLVRMPHGHHDTVFIRACRRVYDPAFAWCTAHANRVMGIALVLLLVSVVLASRLGGEFIPQLQEGDLVVTSTRLPSISLDASIRAATAIERTLRRFPEVETVVSNTGTAAIPTDPQGWEQTDSFILLKPRSAWKTASTQEELVRAFDAALKRDVVGSLFSWSQPIQMRMDDMLSGVRSQIAVGIYGDDLKTLGHLAGQVTELINAIPGAADVAPQDVGTIPFLHIDVDRTAAARLGVDTTEVMDVIEALGGHIGPPVVLNGALIPTQVRFADDAGDSVDKVRNLPVLTRDDHVVRLEQVAVIKLEDGPAAIRRNNGERRMMVQANVRGRDLSSFVAEAQRRVAAQVRLPHGYRIEWSGQFRNMQSALARLEVVVPVALLLIFCLLVAALGEFRLAGLVFVNLPFAATGGIIALFARGMPFSISAGIGFIALFGVAILNGVVLVSCIRLKRQAGMNAVDAAYSAARERFRPVMATATVACLGFFPMAFSMSEGGEVEKPLATVVIGGLISCTALTLLVLPSLYIRIAGGKASGR